MENDKKILLFKCNMMNYQSDENQHYPQTDIARKASKGQTLEQSSLCVPRARDKEKSFICLKPDWFRFPFLFNRRCSGTEVKNH